MIAAQIEKIILQLNALPKGYERNKINSHLQDAIAWAEKYERKYEIAPPIGEECCCPPGARDFTCPVHG